MQKKEKLSAIFKKIMIRDSVSNVARLNEITGFRVPYSIIKHLYKNQYGSNGPTCTYEC